MLDSICNDIQFFFLNKAIKALLSMFKNQVFFYIICTMCHAHSYFTISTMQCELKKLSVGKRGFIFKQQSQEGHPVTNLHQISALLLWRPLIKMDKSKVIFFQYI